MYKTSSIFYFPLPYFILKIYEDTNQTRIVLKTTKRKPQILHQQLFTKDRHNFQDLKSKTLVFSTLFDTIIIEMKQNAIYAHT